MLKTEEIGSYTHLYWRSGISSTCVRNSTSFHSFRYAPLVKKRNFSHSWKKFQIFNRDSCKNLLVSHEWKYYLKSNYLTLRSKVKVSRRSLQYATHRLMVMHPHTKYNWPIWKVMVQTSFAEKKRKKKSD